MASMPYSAASAASANAGFTQQRQQLVVVQRANLAHRAGLPVRAKLTLFRRPLSAGKARMLRRPWRGGYEVRSAWNGKRDFRAVEDRDAAVHLILTGEDVVIDGRLGLLQFQREH